MIGLILRIARILQTILDWATTTILQSLRSVQPGSAGCLGLFAVSAVVVTVFGTKSLPVVAALLFGIKWSNGLLRLLGRQILVRVVPYLPDLGGSMAEIGRRYAALKSIGVDSFVASEEEAILSRVAIAEFGAGAAAFISLVVVAALVVQYVIPLVRLYRDEIANRTYMRQVIQEIFARGGAYPGLPPDWARAKLSGRPSTSSEAVEQLRSGTDDFVGKATEAGPGSLDDRGDAPEPRVKSSPPSKGSQGYGVRPGTVQGGANAPGSAAGARSKFDEAALQRERIAASFRSTDEYNRLVEYHRTLYRQRGIDPCRSGFFPEGCQ